VNYFKKVEILKIGKLMVIFPMNFLSIFLANISNKFIGKLFLNFEIKQGKFKENPEDQRII
jgi:hypothetical protein